MRLSRRRWPYVTSAALLVALALSACSSTAHAPTSTPAAATAVRFQGSGGRTVDLAVEIADTPEERQRGLMFRESLPEDQGMLFDFGGDTQAGFWMKDTKVPLSIAFISAAGVVLNIQDMAPLTANLHYPPQGTYAYAVEANQGWFASHGVAAGSRVGLP